MIKKQSITIRMHKRGISYSIITAFFVLTSIQQIPIGINYFKKINIEDTYKKQKKSEIGIKSNKTKRNRLTSHIT